MNNIERILIIGAAISSCSFTMTMAVVTKPLREWLEPRSPWLGKLFSCPYCFSHWLSLLAVVLSPRLNVFSNPVADFIAQVFCLVTISAIINMATELPRKLEIANHELRAHLKELVAVVEEYDRQSDGGSHDG